MESDKYYRQVTQTVMRWYTEFADGTIEGRMFDSRLLDYRIDVWRMLQRSLSPGDLAILLAVHERGLAPDQAVRSAALEASVPPESVVERIEVRLGRRIERYGLANILAYLK